MVERLAARPGGGDEDRKVLAELLLADELGERERAERGFAAILRGRLGRHHAGLAHGLSSLRPARIR